MENSSKGIQCLEIVKHAQKQKNTRNTPQNNVKIYTVIYQPKRKIYHFEISDMFLSATFITLK